MRADLHNKHRKMSRSVSCTRNFLLHTHTYTQVPYVALNIPALSRRRSLYVIQLFSPIGHVISRIAIDIALATAPFKNCCAVAPVLYVSHDKIALIPAMCATLVQYIPSHDLNATLVFHIRSYYLLLESIRGR